MATKPKWYSITFTGANVEKILDGRKTETRRLVNWPLGYRDESDSRRRHAAKIVNEGGKVPRLRNPYGVAGDLLWVREKWIPMIAHSHYEGGSCECDDVLVRYSNGSRDGKFIRGSVIDQTHPDWVLPEAAREGHWVSPLLMPRFASRVSLVNRGVRMEPLSAITGESVIAEGIDLPTGFDESDVARDRDNVSVRLRFDFLSAFRKFHGLDDVADPWVRVVRFELQS